MKPTWLVATVLVMSLGERAAEAACHVVRAGASGGGADWASAYPDLPKTLVRGDVYYLAAGTYAPHDFADPDSGTQIIEVRSATATDHCTDAGWNASYVGQALFVASAGHDAVMNFDTDYYVINGQTRGADWKSGYGIKLDDTNKAACEADVSGGLGGKGVHDITLEYVEVDGSHATTDTCNEEGIEFLNGSHDLAFRSIWNHDVGNANFLLRGGGGAKNFTIEQSWIADDYSSPAVHGEACSCSEGLQNFVMRYNYWADIIGTAFIATPSGAGFHTGNDNNGPWYVYGNVFLATTGRDHCGVGDGVLTAFDVSFSGDIYFANNTIANINQKNCTGLDSTGIQFGAGYKAGLQSVYVQNNLWWNSDQVSIVGANTCNGPDVTCTSLAWNHNAYFQLADGSAQNDTDPAAQIGASDPFIGSATNDFRLAQATSAGIALTVTNQTFDTDMLGTPRGADAVWDRGAFEFSKCTSDVDCKPADACHVAGKCDTQSGVCSSVVAPNGTACPNGECSAGACVATSSDAGADATESDGGSSSGSSGGCGCRVEPSSRRDAPWLAVIVLGAALRRRRAPR